MTLSRLAGNHLTLDKVCAALLQESKLAGTFKVERVLESKQQNVINVKGQQVINFCANNYLGLSSHPHVISKSSEYLHKFGAGLSSVRFICGTQSIHKDLERTISTFHSKQDTILYPSCFDANAGIFEAILTNEDAVISDELNHASIIDGIRLCKAKRFRYKHTNMKSLEECLIQADKDSARIKLIATDGVFSMDGVLAPLDQICKLARKHSAFVFVDECHATGFLGPGGRGSPAYFGVEDQVDIINSTLGKALGGASGGYTTASENLVSVLRQKARPYLFSNSIPPSVVGAAVGAFDLVMSEEGDKLRKQLFSNVEQFRSEMKKAGFTLKGDQAIVPVMLHDAKLASQFADEMLKLGIYVIGFSYPVVPKGQARIRVQLSAAHSTEQVDKCIKSFISVGKKLKVI
jgi:glycine C-acetyltransferase